MKDINWLKQYSMDSYLHINIPKDLKYLILDYLLFQTKNGAFLNEEKHGRWLEYNRGRTGMNITLGYYHHGKNHGIFRKFDVGQTQPVGFDNINTFPLLSYVTYSYGIREGEYKEWHPIHRYQTVFGNYHNDKKEGVWIHYQQVKNYSVQTRIKSLTTYCSGLRHGEYRTYHYPTFGVDSVKLSGIYRNDEKYGIWREFNMGGQQIREKVY
jgi:antitoxin component YwqK of YwqJK toxin-antitoxin module